MRFQADESGIFRLLMGFLKEKKLFETLNSLQLECGQADEDLGSDLLYLQKLVLEGRWKDVLLFVKPFSTLVGQRYDKVEYVIGHQQLLEALSWQGGGGHRHAMLPWKAAKSVGAETDGELEVEVVVKLLNSLERLCPPKEFASLCSCLTLERLSDNPDYSDWTVSQGRLHAFQKLKSIVGPFIERKSYKNQENAQNYSNGGLVSMLAMALAYQAQHQGDSDSRKGTNTEGDATLNAVFDGTILAVKNRNGRPFPGSILLPTLTVTGQISNQLYLPDTANPVRSQMTPSLQLSADTTSIYRGVVDVLDRNGAGVSEQMRVGPVSNRAHAAPTATTSSSPITNQADSVQSPESFSSPVKQIAQRTAPVAWTVDGEFNKESGVEKNRDREKEWERERAQKIEERKTNRRATITSGISVPSDVRSPDRMDGGRDEKDWGQERESAVRHQTNLSGRSNSANRNRRDTVTHIGSVPEGGYERHSNDAVRNRRDTVSNIGGGSVPDRAHEGHNTDANRNRRDTVSNISSAVPERVHDVHSNEAGRSRRDTVSNIISGAVPERVHEGHYTDAGRNRRDTVTSIVSGPQRVLEGHSTGVVKSRPDTVTSVGGGAVERVDDGRGDKSPSKPVHAKDRKGKVDIDFSVLYQTDCPLRCVCLLTDQREREKQPPSSSSSSSSSASAWQFAVGSNDKSVKIARVSRTSSSSQGSTTEVVRDFLEVHRGSIYAIDWRTSFEGQGQGMLATASNDKVIRILNVDTGNVSGPFKGHTGTIRSVSFQSKSSADSSTILASVGAGDNVPRIWDVHSGTLHTALSGHGDAVHGLTWMGGEGPSGSLILTGCEGGSVIAHDLRMGGPAWTLDLSTNSQLVTGGGTGVCCLSSLSSVPVYSRPSDGLVVAGCTGGFVCVINTATRSIVATHKPHTDDVRAISVHASASGNVGLGSGPKSSSSSFSLVTTSFDSTGAIWNVSNSSNVSTNYLSFEKESVMQSHSDKILGVISTVRNGVVEVLTTGADGKAILWSQRNSSARAKLR